MVYLILKGKAMTEYLSSPGYYSARQAAQKLGVSEARIRKLASIYGWECYTLGLTQMFSAVDVGRYIEAREHFRRQLDSGKNNRTERSVFE
jgi:hypothetical protein